MFIAIRITRPFTELGTFLDYIVERSDVVVVAEHGVATGTGNETHCHIHCNPTVGYHALRNRLREDFAGNAEWSCKKKYKRNNKVSDIDDGHITYALKGKLEPCFVKGVSEEQINLLRSKWVANVATLVVPPGTLPVNEVVEQPVLVRDPSLRTKLGVLERIKACLTGYSYDCQCLCCKSVRRTGQTCLPVVWSLEKVHENQRELIRIISEVIIESGKPPCFQDVQQYVYSVYYTPFVNPDGWRTPDFIFQKLYL